jgi:hypothetical protein
MTSARLTFSAFWFPAAARSVLVHGMLCVESAMHTHSKWSFWVQACWVVGETCWLEISELWCVANKLLVFKDWGWPFIIFSSQCTIAIGVWTYQSCRQRFPLLVRLEPIWDVVEVKSSNFRFWADSLAGCSFRKALSYSKPLKGNKWKCTDIRKLNLETQTEDTELCLTQAC